MSNRFEQLGPYKLGKKLGQGGMGAVFEGTDTETGSPVAVKVLAPALAAEEGFRARFEAEIESLRKLKHPNIVRLFGYGEQDGTMFYAMERVEGTSLEDEIRNGRRFQWREVVEITIKMCKALKHAHDDGIIHRDIKPANILLTHDGDVKLSDFGIARLFGNTRMTSDGGVLGTAEYMAPEQADGRAVTDRADQYSLGGVMFALLAGRPPFRASSFVEMLQMQRFSEAQPVRRYAPDTPAELDRIIAQLLEKDPAKRFVNTIMLARALEAMEKGLSLSSARDDFLIADPKRTVQPHLTGLDPYAATLVPSEQPLADPGYSIAPDPIGTIIHTGEVVPPVAVERAPAAPTSFTRVSDRRVEESTWYEELLYGLLSPQTLATLLALLIVISGVVYLLKPKSAEQLYDQITTEVGDGGIEQLRVAEPRIDEFLDRFADDPRAAELRQYQQELALSRRARLARMSAKVPGRRQTMSPIERAYVEASTLAERDPEAAVAKLSAIVDLYGDESLKDADGKDFVEIARQDLARLQDDLHAGAGDQLKLLESRLAAAQALEEQDPATSKRILKGIVELYGSKPWAAEVVEKARQSLAKSPSSP